MDENRMAARGPGERGAFDNTGFQEGVEGFLLIVTFFTGVLDFTFTHTMVMNSLL